MCCRSTCTGTQCLPGEPKLQTVSSCEAMVTGVLPQSENEVDMITSRKVDLPMARLSDAPMRVNTESKTCMCTLSAGTKDPICMHMPSG